MDGNTLVKSAKTNFHLKVSIRAKHVKIRIQFDLDTTCRSVECRLVDQTEVSIRAFSAGKYPRSSTWRTIRFG